MSAKIIQLQSHLYYILQSKKHSFREFPSSALKVRVYILSARRVLKVVSHLDKKCK